MRWILLAVVVVSTIFAQDMATTNTIPVADDPIWTMAQHMSPTILIATLGSWFISKGYNKGFNLTLTLELRPEDRAMLERLTVAAEKGAGRHSSPTD